MRGQPPLPVQRPQPGQHGARLSEGPARRRVQQGQPLRRGRAPARQIERQSGQVALNDLRRLVADQAAGLFLVPQPVADPGLRPPGAAAPLLGRGAADPHCGQSRQAAGRLEPRDARQAAVDHHPHALNGQAGLGHGGGQHHLATTGRRRLQRLVLLRLVERAIEGRDIHRRVAQTLGQQAGDAVDLPLPRQEDEQRTGLGRQRRLDGPNHGDLQPLDRVAAEIAGVDRKHPSLGGDHRRPVQQAAHRLDVEGGRHHQQPQVVAQRRLGLTRQREAKVGVETALVELVEQHRRDPLERRVVQNHAREDALGDHLDARRRPDPALQAGAVADPAAGGLAQRRRHAFGRRPRRQPPRLQQQDAAVAAPRGVQQGQRHDRGLAGSGRGRQHRRIARREGGRQRLEDVMDRQAHRPHLPQGRKIVTRARRLAPRSQPRGHDIIL